MEFIAVIIRQLPTYIMASILFYKFFSYSEKPKYSAIKMITLGIAISYISRIICSIFSIIYALQYTIIAGTIFLISNSFLYSPKRKGLFLAKEAILWILEYIYEWILAKIVGPLVWTEIDMNLNLPEEDFMKIVYIAILFIGFTIYDILYQKRKETVIKYIAILNLITGSMQVFLLKLCLNKNLIAGKTQISSVTFLFSFVLVMEYFLTMEIFRESLEQKEKESELEQMRLKQKYEYDYYQFAQKQGEEIRDIRHDLRNQLQTIQYMLKYGNEKEEKIGKEMLEQLKIKLNYLK